MAKQKPHAKPTTTRCECERSDLKDLKLLALNYELGSNPDAFRAAVIALREKCEKLLRKRLGEQA